MIAELPKVPSYFAKRLKQERSNLHAKYNPGTRMWDIFQKIKYWRIQSRYQGVNLWMLVPQDEKVISSPGLGGQVIQELKMHWTPRYNSMESMMKALGIRDQNIEDRLMGA